MNDLDVRIVRLEPMRVAAAIGFGPSPEELAWQKILSWADAQGLLKERERRRFFGFNNPNPSAGSPNYGYEQWITVEADTPESGEVKIKDFPGGLFAVTRCSLADIGDQWQALVKWCAGSRYTMSHTQWLEEALTPPYDGISQELNQIILDLYLPVAE
ncbi:MAG: GyrI-like domain-containing protein [Anaerolineaceae bacterium]|jgi:DNA gyrase inhibitor GyrI